MRVGVCVSVKLIKRFLCCSGGCAKLFAEIQLAAGNFYSIFGDFFIYCFVLVDCCGKFLGNSILMYSSLMTSIIQVISGPYALNICSGIDVV